MRRRGMPEPETAEYLPVYVWVEGTRTVSQDRVGGGSPSTSENTTADDIPVVAQWPPRFSRWYPWSERARFIANRWQAGVYALARFPNGSPTGAADPLDAAIVYIGETCTRTLDTRWKEFDGSAFAQRNGHSGGWEYWRRYVASEAEHAAGRAVETTQANDAPPPRVAPDARAGLYVAGFTVISRPLFDPDDNALRRTQLYVSAFIRYAERRLIWEYLLARGTCPSCNRK
jgi:hypothetical protein